MCGIAGFWQIKRSSEHPIETLNRMGAALKHRGPNDGGIFHDDASGIGFAFRRLSILDLSPEGHQPMFSASGRFVIVFNGEVYNHEEIKADLGLTHWRGRSDTEVILEAIERWGLTSAVQRFVGMFAIGLWDRQDKKLFLVRDRLGIKPLYYGRAGTNFVFASELKAIWQHSNFEGEINRDVLALYMRHNYVPSPHCIYKKLNKLQPGFILTLNSAQEEPTLHQYWSAREVARQGVASPLDVNEIEAIEQLHEKLLAAVGLRMISDVPIGAFLSGGVDSSAVVALMQSQSNRPIKTFTIGFQEDQYNEARHAKKVAQHLGTDHTELYLTAQDALDVVPLLPSMYDEPFADCSQIPTFLVSKLAKSGVTVSLSGDGGDELFGGYNRYISTKKIWNRIRRVPQGLRSIATHAILNIPPVAIDQTFHLFRQILPQRIQPPSPGDKAHKLAAFLELNSPNEIYFRALSHWQTPSDIVVDSHEPETVLAALEGATFSPNIEDAMMLTDSLTYLPDDILTKVDRASMAVSLEARVPLLDHRVFEFAWKLPLHFKIHNGMSKWVLRKVLYKYIPSKLIERPKMGFGVPIDRWLRGPLKDWAEALLSAESLAEHGFFETEPIREKWQEHLSGMRNWQYLLWDVLSFQDWYFANRSFNTKQVSVAAL